MKTKIQTDNYTKFILTLIAICLVWICIRDIKVVPALHAATSDTVDVRIKSIEREPGQSWDPVMINILDNLPVDVKNTIAIPVEVKNELLPVDVKKMHVKRDLVIFEDKK